MNISTNPNYKNYIDASSIGWELHENISHSEDSLSLIIKEDEELEFEKKQQKEMEKCDKNLFKMMENGEIGGEVSESGRTQILLIF